MPRISADTRDRTLAVVGVLVGLLGFLALLGAILILGAHPAR